MDQEILASLFLTYSQNLLIYARKSNTTWCDSVKMKSLEDWNVCTLNKRNKNSNCLPARRESSTYEFDSIIEMDVFKKGGI